MSLQAKLDAGEFAVLVEIEPPKGVGISSMVSHASRVKSAVDAFVVPEMSNAVMRMSALGGAMVLQNKGMETVMQVCCRDRNRIALQADLLAAHACGITNIMAVTGEDPSYGDHHQAKAVYDINLPELLDVLQKLQAGRDMAGVDLAGAPAFLTGSDINAAASGPDLEPELASLEQKRKAGVGFFISPPVFDLSSTEAFISRVDRVKTPVLPTVLLLKSAGMARYIDRNLAHVHVPEDLIKRIQRAPDKVRECTAIAAETIGKLKAGGFSGALVSTIGWEDKLPQILERAPI